MTERSSTEVETAAGRPGRTPIPASERLIVALDVPDAASARALVERLGEEVRFYKVGLELFLSGDCFPLLAWLRERGRRVFVDLKLFDVPRTVEAAVRSIGAHDVDFLTVHGNDGILEAACRARAGRLGILAVTALTSLDRRDMEDLGFRTDLESLVVSRAGRAREIGCDGVIASGLEARSIRERVGPDFLIVVPGIRPSEARGSDDQKRTVDVEEAFRRGADHIVVGRPIRNAEEPREAAAAIQARIAALFAG